jgi:biotin-[acetyl-CoA-carboxylase] ligase BirA-like protein
MRYFTDQPRNMERFLPHGATWRKAVPDGWDAADQMLWNVFGAGGACWTCDVPVSSGAPYPDRRLLLMDTASASQFDAAMAALKKGDLLPDGLICIALEGTRFRGQRNRPWMALRGNLHLTAHYRVDSPAAQVETGLTMLPAVASARAIRTASNGRARAGIKWVNDILLDGKKVSGVLTATHVQGADVERAVFGVGINVERAPVIESTPFVPAAGSLSAYGLSPASLFNEVVAELDAGMGALRETGSSALFGHYRDMADFIGRAVCIWPESCEDWRTAQPSVQGQVRALNADLSLEIEGQADPVRKGRMSYVTS